MKIAPPINPPACEPSSLLLDCAVASAKLQAIADIADGIGPAVFGGGGSRGWKDARAARAQIRVMQAQIAEISRDELRGILNVRPRECAAVPALDANGLRDEARRIIAAGGYKRAEATGEPSAMQTIKDGMDAALLQMAIDETDVAAVGKILADALRAAKKKKDEAGI